jgi:S-disulfanyl-L-cysteine oxidoreductase SoxD
MEAFTTRCSSIFVFVIVASGCSAAAAQTTRYENVGRTPTQEEIRVRDISVGPQGKELPPGKGTAREGAPIYAAKCAGCHGPTGEEDGPLGPRLIGTKKFEKGTVIAWPFATTIWDFINRAMPRYNEGTLKPDQVYSLTALLLYRSGIIKEDDVLDARSLPEVQMPNRNGYVPSRLEDLADVKKRGCRLGHCPGPDPDAAH